MDLTKHIEVDGYKFELTLTTKDVKAHSCLTDYKTFVETAMNTARETVTQSLRHAVANHKENNK